MQFDLLGLAHSVKRQRHNMGAVKDVLVATGACHRGDLAAVKADADVADELRRGGRGGVRHRAAEMEPWKRQEQEKGPSMSVGALPSLC